MGTFFKGWHRKLGVVALGLACLFAAGWVRSFVTCDYLTLPGWHEDGEKLISVDGRLVWCTDYYEPPFKWSQSAYFSFAESFVREDAVADWNVMGFIRGKWEGELFQTVPYWSIVIPLTLLSAWLLLSKPKRLPSEMCGD